MTRKRRRIFFSAEELGFIEARKIMLRAELHAAFVAKFTRDELAHWFFWHCAQNRVRVMPFLKPGIRSIRIALISTRYSESLCAVHL
jgi:hypothetical protein